MNIHRNKVVAGMGILLPLVCLAALVSGAFRISPQDVFGILAGRLFGLSRPEGAAATVVLDVRLPRMLTAVIVGLGLAAAGTVFQGLFRNPLVEPYILGVSSGAAFGAALSIVYGAAFFPLQLSSFIFGLAAIGLAMAAARRRGRVPVIHLILAGVVINSLFTAGLSFLKMTAGARELRELTFWLMGGLYASDWDTVRLLSVQVVPGVLILWSFGWKLNVLSVGEEEAVTLGVRVTLLRTALMALAAYITSLCVSAVGIIAWVGLVIPHICRMLTGPDHRTLIPASALMGAGFLVFCDTLARVLIDGEIPVSIITAITGAPYLFYLIRTNRRIGFAS